MTSQTERTYVAPAVSMETEAFWQAADEGKFLLKTCGDCNQIHYYQRAICPHCMSDNTEWVEASGKAKIYTFTVLRRVAIPYAVAYVTLQEGPTIMTNIVDCDFDTLAVGMDVEVTFRKTDGGHDLPVFRPAA